jgi:hypothetical protein
VTQSVKWRSIPNIPIDWHNIPIFMSADYVILRSYIRLSPDKQDKIKGNYFEYVLEKVKKKVKVRFLEVQKGHK